jgi:hypothetical protein
MLIFILFFSFEQKKKDTKPKEIVVATFQQRKLSTMDLHYLQL